jgi:O-antigen/teichoic acid export membrane protein
MSAAENERTSIGKGTLFQMVAYGAFILSGYALNISMVYILGDPVAYGLLGIMINVTNIARVALSSGLPNATSKFIAESPPELAYPILRTSLKIQWIVAGAIVIVFIGGADVWGRLLNDTSLTPYFWACAPLIPLMGVYQVILSHYNGTHRFVSQAWIQILYAVTRVAFGVALVFMGFKVFGVLYGFAFSLALCAGLAWFYIRPRGGIANPVSRKLLAFALPLMVLGIGQAVLVNLDLLQIKSYFPTSVDVGYYSGMASLSRTPYFLFVAFSVTLLPVVTTTLKEHGRERAGEVIARTVTFLLLAALPVLAVFAAVPGPLLDFVFPRAYTVAGPALVWASIAQTMLALVAALTAVITAKGKPYLAAGAWLVCIPVQLAAGALLIPRYGMTGTAIASLIAAIAGVVFSGWLTMRYFGRLMQPVPVLKAAAASLVIYLLLSIPRTWSMWVLPFACIGALGLYGVLVMVTGAVKREEVMSLFRKERDVVPMEGIDEGI